MDLEISTKFKSLYHELESQESKLSELKLEPIEALGCIIVLDQYARNMFRDTPKGTATIRPSIQDMSLCSQLSR